MAGFLLLLLQTGHPAEAASPPDGAVRMSPGELWDLYSGKTQLWKEGVGGYYFAPDRTLSGYSHRKVPTYASGKWYITHSGKVCVVAAWVWGKGPQDRGPMEKNCWDHRKFGEQIWKNDGGWYHWNRSGGESSRFIDGDKYRDLVTVLRADLL